MTPYANPFADICHSQLEASRRFADVLFAGTERIDHCMLEVTHRAFTEQVNLAHAALSMRDPRELAHLQSSMAAHRPDSAVNLQKEMVRVFAEIQNEMGRSIKDYIEKFGSSVARSATAPMRSAQERVGDTLFNPFGGMFGAWESMVREMASMTSKNMSTMRSSYEHMAEEVAQATVSASANVADQGARMAQSVAEQAQERMQERAQEGLDRPQAQAGGNVATDSTSPSTSSAASSSATSPSPAAGSASNGGNGGNGGNGQARQTSHARHDAEGASSRQSTSASRQSGQTSLSAESNEESHPEERRTHKSTSASRRK